MEVADRIVVMNHGRIEQDGPPDEVYDHPATPFVLQFLGDVNLFHGRYDRAGAAGGEVSYVRPHELQILGTAEAGSIPVTLSQALTVGPNTRLEFKRADDASYVDVELSREEYLLLRESIGLKTGATVHLRPRRVTTFSSEGQLLDPAAAI
jgi:sulfate transport system ATP-binding protein